MCTLRPQSPDLSASITTNMDTSRLSAAIHQIRKMLRGLQHNWGVKTRSAFVVYSARKSTSPGTPQCVHRKKEMRRAEQVKTSLATRWPTTKLQISDPPHIGYLEKAAAKCHTLSAQTTTKAAAARATASLSLAQIKRIYEDKQAHNHPDPRTEIPSRQAEIAAREVGQDANETQQD